MTAKKTTAKSAPKSRKTKPAANATPADGENIKTPEATTPTTGTDTKTATTKKARDAKPKKPSALDAAAKVLAEAGTAMNCKEMVEAMAAKGYWTSPGGRTPAQTLYAAILRETQAKGTGARFTKTQRGTFALNGADTTTATRTDAATKKSRSRPAKPAARTPATIPDGTPGPKSMSELFRLS